MELLSTDRYLDLRFQVYYFVSLQHNTLVVQSTARHSFTDVPRVPRSSFWALINYHCNISNAFKIGAVKETWFNL